MKRSLTALVLAAAALSACREVGPDYHLPSQAVINAPAARGGFVGAKENAAVTEAQPPDHWWRLYDDPRLDALVEQAFAANINLRVAEANLERAHALLAEARAAGRPDITVNLNASYAQLSAEQYLQTEMIPATGLYDVGLALSYQLDLWGGIRRGVEAAAASDEAAVAARDLARVNVAAEVTRAYVDVCAAGAELAAARRVLAVQQRQLAMTRRMTAAGRGVPLDVTRGQGQIAAFQADIPALLTRQRNAILRLATLAGRPPAASDETLAACDVAPRLDAPLPVGDGAALLARRPDVRAAERRLAAATATIGVRMAALYPTVTLGASAGSTGDFGTFFGPLTLRYGVGPGLTWHLDRTADRARVAQAEAQTRADLAMFDGAVLDALREVEDALDRYQHDRERAANLHVAAASAADALTVAQRLQRAGRGSSFQTLDAERTYAATQSALAASATQIAADQVGLFMALGGGWENGSAAPPPAPQPQ
jgi:NodT family efflux transporter outer membrane factor (OMF) lipoprotein